MSKMLSLDALAPGFAHLSDVTGKSMDRDTLEDYARRWGAEHLSIDAVLGAIRDLAYDWDEYRWPSAGLIASKARKRMREGRELSSPADDRDEACEIADEKKWASRSEAAGDWFQKNQTLANELVREIDYDISRFAGTLQSTRFTQSPGYRKAFRDGSIVGACIRQMAAGHTRGAQKETREREAKLAQAKAHLRVVA